MPKRPYEWRGHSHGCYKFDNATLGLGPRDQSAHLPVFLHLRTTNLPGPSSVMRSEQAQQRRFEAQTQQRTYAETTFMIALLSTKAQHRRWERAAGRQERKKRRRQSSRHVEP